MEDFVEKHYFAVAGKGEGKRAKKQVDGISRDGGLEVLPLVRFGDGVIVVICGAEE
jgi:hypothetical protein